MHTRRIGISGGTMGPPVRPGYSGGPARPRSRASGGSGLGYRVAEAWVSYMWLGIGNAPIMVAGASIPCVASALSSCLDGAKFEKMCENVSYSLSRKLCPVFAGH